MTYEEKKNLIDAVQTINKICARNRALYDKDCECPMKNNDRVECEFWRNQIPTEWNIPIITRWTPEDVALAKALKAAGAELIYRSGKNEAVYWRGNSTMDLGVLPADAFINMGNCESLLIDTIIKEAKG